MSYLYFWIIGIIILGIQYVLTRFENKYLGGILPLLFLCFMVWLYNYHQPDNIISFAIATLGGFVMLASIWESGRTAIKNKRKKELEKIKLHDI